MLAAKRGFCKCHKKDQVSSENAARIVRLRLALRVARVEQTYHERGKSIERVDRMQYKRKGDEGMMSSEIQRWIINAIKSPSMHA